MEDEVVEEEVEEVVDEEEVEEVVEEEELVEESEEGRELELESSEVLVTELDVDSLDETNEEVPGIDVDPVVSLVELEATDGESDCGVSGSAVDELITG